MVEQRYRSYVIRPSSDQSPDRQWHPRGLVFWNDGGVTIEQQLYVREDVVRTTEDAANEYAVKQLAVPWIDGRRP